MKTIILARALEAVGVTRYSLSAWPWSGVLCLNYHRIGDGSASVYDRGLWSAQAEAFDAQVGFLKANFDVIGPDDLSDVLMKRRGRYCLITFDDGYKDNYETAFPILRGHAVGATFFVSTGFLDNPRLSWWDEIAWMVRMASREKLDVRPWVDTPLLLDEVGRESAIRLLLAKYKQLSEDDTSPFMGAIALATGCERPASAETGGVWMSWDMVREMHRSGMTIGGHTVNHPVLARLPRERQWAEIAECCERLRQELGVPVKYFSYPVGGKRAFDQHTRDCLRQAGVKFAFSYYGGMRSFDDWDDYDIRRVAVEPEVAGPVFRAVVSMPGVFARART